MAKQVAANFRQLSQYNASCRTYTGLANDGGADCQSDEIGWVASKLRQRCGERSNNDSFLRQVNHEAAAGIVCMCGRMNSESPSFGSTSVSPGVEAIWELLACPHARARHAAYKRRQRAYRSYAAWKKQA